MRQHTRHLSPAMCEPCCHLAQIYWQITDWTLLYIFSVFCPDLLIVEMGMRSEDVQGRPAQSLGSARPHSCTLYYRVLTSLSPAIFIFIICWGVRSEERHSTHTLIVITHELTPCIRLQNCSGWGHKPQHQRLLLHEKYLPIVLRVQHGGFQHSLSPAMDIVLHTAVS